MAGGALRERKPRFSTMYATTRRPPIAPEKLLRARLLKVPYPVRNGSRNRLAICFLGSLTLHLSFKLLPSRSGFR